MRIWWLALLGLVGCSRADGADPRRATSSPPPEPPAESASAAAEPRVRLAFVGDVALTSRLGRLVARRLRGQSLDVRAAAAPGFPFDALLGRLRAADFTMGNLECVASSLGRSAVEHTALYCPPIVLGALLEAGFDAMSVANNHALDHGPRAFDDTLRQLEAARIAHVGAASMKHLPQAPVVRDVRGVRVALLGYYRPPPQPLDDVKRARREAHVVVVYNHWGREHQVEPMPQQRELARRLIDAGADIVVGAHAHVLQPIERYRGKLVAYGLGNFVFDAMPLREIHRRGAILEVEVSRAGVGEHRLVRTRMDEYLRPLPE